MYNKEYTADMGNGIGIPDAQRDMFVIKFSEYQWSGSNGKLTEMWHHHIAFGGYVTSHIDSMSSADDNLSKKCITKVEEWNAHSIYFFYEEVCNKSAALGIRLLPRPHFKRGITDPRSFITGDVFQNKNVIILA